MKSVARAKLCLTIGLAIVFLYAAIAATISPDNWIGYFPEVIKRLIPGGILLPAFSVFQALLGVWLLSGWKSRLSGLVAALALAGIILANLSVLDVVFRDVGLLFAAIALTLLA